MACPLRLATNGFCSPRPAMSGPRRSSPSLRHRPRGSRPAPLGPRAGGHRRDPREYSAVVRSRRRRNHVVDDMKTDPALRSDSGHSSTNRSSRATPAHLGARHPYRQPPEAMMASDAPCRRIPSRADQGRMPCRLVMGRTGQAQSVRIHNLRAVGGTRSGDPSAEARGSSR
jgi:hypothetical protein